MIQVTSLLYLLEINFILHRIRISIFSIFRNIRFYKASSCEQETEVMYKGARDW